MLNQRNPHVRKENSDIRIGHFLLWGLVCLFPTLVVAQVPTFTTVVSSNQVPLNGVFDIQFVLENGEGSNFQPPSFSDFKVVGGPSRASSTTIINGEMSSSQSWSYSLLATKTGKFTIGPASIVAGRRKLNSTEVTIEVAKGRDLSSPGNTATDQNVMLVAEIEKRDYYPGQQIILNYRILFSQNIQSIDVLSEDDYADFYVQNFSDFSKDPAITRIKGKDYTSRIIKSIALFPHQSGEYQIDPLIMSVTFSNSLPGMQGLFTMRRMQEERVSSEPLKLTILPLPPNAPVSFRGAVGKYSIKAYKTASSITTDDALTLQVEINGDGDAKRWDPPTPDVDTSFQLYDPKIIYDQPVEQGGRIQHKRNIEYQMIPQRPGKFTVTVPFSYFDPVAHRYVSINTDPVSVLVTQGTGKPRAVARQDEVALNDFEILPLHSNLFPDRFWSSWLHLLLIGLVLSGSVWSGLIAWRKRNRSKISEAERVRSVAGRKTILQLEHLSKSAGSISAKEFYEQLTGIYNKFLCDRMVISPADLDESKLPVYLAKNKVQQEMALRAMNLFNQFLPVRYGGLPSGMSKEEMLAECKAVVSSI